MLPLVNGTAYDYTQIIARIAGVVMPSISSIDYEETQEKVNNYGLGNRPVSRGRGAIETSVSIEMSMNDVELIRGSAPNGSLLAIPPFDITIHFANPQNPRTHVLKNCEFTTDGMSGAQGDGDLKKSFDLTCSHIVYS